MGMSKFGIWREMNVGNPVAGTNAPVVSNPGLKLNDPAKPTVEDAEDAEGSLARLINLISPVKSITGNANDMANILIRINKEILKLNRSTNSGILQRAQAMKVFNALMGKNSPTNENK
jgi:hypothetical protein